MADDLLRHNCLCFSLDDMVYDRWSWTAPDGQLVSLRVSGNRSADDADVVRRWAVSGVGIAYKSQLDVADDVREGRLLVLLPDWAGEPVPLHLVCMHRAQVTPTVIRLRDFLRAQCAAIAGAADAAGTARDGAGTAGTAGTAGAAGAGAAG